MLYFPDIHSLFTNASVSIDLDNKVIEMPKRITVSKERRTDTQAGRQKGQKSSYLLSSVIIWYMEGRLSRLPFRG